MTPDTRVTSLTISNLPVYMVGEVLEVLRETFGEEAIEINLDDSRERQTKLDEMLQTRIDEVNNMFGPVKGSADSQSSVCCKDHREAETSGLTPGGSCRE